MKVRMLLFFLVLLVATGSSAQESGADIDLRIAARQGDAARVRALLEQVKPDSEAGAAALSAAAEEGQTEILRILLHAGVDPSSEHPDSSPLYKAASHDHAEAACLIFKKLTPGQKKSQGGAALSVAAFLGKVISLEALLKCGTNPNWLDAQDDPPLISAGHGGHLRAASLLLDAGADTKLLSAAGETALMAAAGGSNPQLVRLLLRGEANANARTESGVTALMIAALVGPTDSVRALLQADADPNPVLENGVDALMLAGFRADREAIVALTDAGASINRTDSWGWGALTWAEAGEALHVYEDRRGGYEYLRSKDARAGLRLAPAALETAIYEGDAQAVQKYLAASGDVNAPIFRGETLLGVAARTGRMEMVRLLINAGADVNRTMRLAPVSFAWSNADSKGYVVKAMHEAAEEVNGFSTPLMEAARAGHVEVVRALLKAGADQHRPVDTKDTPLHMAAMRGHVEVARVLLESGAKVDAPNMKGETALHAAVGQSGSPEFVKVLLQAGANPDAKDHEGRSAKEWAEEYNPELLPLFSQRILPGAGGLAMKIGVGLFAVAIVVGAHWVLNRGRLVR